MYCRCFKPSRSRWSFCCSHQMYPIKQFRYSTYQFKQVALDSCQDVLACIFIHPSIITYIRLPRLFVKAFILRIIRTQQLHICPIPLLYVICHIFFIIVIYSPSALLGSVGRFIFHVSLCVFFYSLTPSLGSANPLRGFQVNEGETIYHTYELLPLVHDSFLNNPEATPIVYVLSDLSRQLSHCPIRSVKYCARTLSATASAFRDQKPLGASTYCRYSYCRLHYFISSYELVIAVSTLMYYNFAERCRQLCGSMHLLILGSCGSFLKSDVLLDSFS